MNTEPLDPHIELVVRQLLTTTYDAPVTRECVVLLVNQLRKLTADLRVAEAVIAAKKLDDFISCFTTTRAN